MEKEKKCPVCGGIGFIFTEKGVKKCECLYRSFNLNKFLNIPKRFWEADINANKVKEILDEENYASLQKYLADFKQLYKKGTGFLLIGSGDGKTYIASAILKYIYQKYKLRGFS